MNTFENEKEIKKFGDLTITNLRIVYSKPSIYQSIPLEDVSYVSVENIHKPAYLYYARFFAALGALLVISNVYQEIATRELSSNSSTVGTGVIILFVVFLFCISFAFYYLSATVVLNIGSKGGKITLNATEVANQVYARKIIDTVELAAYYHTKKMIDM